MSNTTTTTTFGWSRKDWLFTYYYYYYSSRRLGFSHQTRANKKTKAEIQSKRNESVKTIGFIRS